MDVGDDNRIEARIRSLLDCLDLVRAHMNRFGRSTAIGGAENKLKEELQDAKTDLSRHLLGCYLLEKKLNG